MLQIEEISSQYYFSDSAISSILELINEEFPCNKSNITSKLINNDYCSFLVVNKKKGEVCGIITYNIISNLSSIKNLDIYNFLIKNNSESQQTAQHAISWLETIAMKKNCQLVTVKLTTKNIFLQKIFAMHKFNLNQFTFEKKL